MVERLKELIDRYHVVGVKAEFEAEGTRTEELMRLKEICLAAGSPLTLKIGGCEAVRDMYDARAIGVDQLVAPMVETPFALQKYLRAVDVAFPADEQKEIDFLVNIETIQAVRNFEPMLAVEEIEGLDGVVIGRSDLVGSMSLDKREINGPAVFEVIREVLVRAKSKNLICVIGGTISVDSLPFLKGLAGLLDRFETRKVCFNCAGALAGEPETGLKKALEFELLWLQNKQNYYRAISEEDNKRIAELVARCQAGREVVFKGVNR